MLCRCLFLYESAFHPSFLSVQTNASANGSAAANAGAGGGPCLKAARLSWDVHENQGFFRALFAHMQFVGRRGCTLTAFTLVRLFDRSIDCSLPRSLACPIT